MKRQKRQTRKEQQKTGWNELLKEHCKKHPPQIDNVLVIDRGRVREMSASIATQIFQMRYEDFALDEPALGEIRVIVVLGNDIRVGGFVPEYYRMPPDPNMEQASDSAPIAFDASMAETGRL